LDDWFDAKKAETAPSTMTFYRTSLAKFLQFLGKRSDNPMTEVTKQDVVAFRNSLITQVSAKTANHDLKALKMLAPGRARPRLPRLGAASVGRFSGSMEPLNQCHCPDAAQQVVKIQRQNVR
jgi:hypothetical protein